MAPDSNIPEKKKTPTPTGKSSSTELKKSTAADFKKNRLGKYQIKKKIGAGGMGAVYLAVDVELGRTVALKILPREKAQNPTLVKRFKAEGQAAALLRHENIVTVYEAGEADGFLYLALEYIEGTDVHNLVAKRGVLPVKRTIEIIRQLTRALQHAYEQNIVHRDMKPSNFLIKRDGTVKLTDMGLARSIDETSETSITRAGTTVGTVDYMSPEQARDSKAADVRSDIYSLGCSWYQMLTGEAPFSEGSMTNKLAAHATKPPPDPRDKNDAVPEGVVAVIRKMMAKNPEDRYQTAAELLEDLDNKTLTRGSVSNNVLEALAGADGESAAAKRLPTPPRSIELPPKMEAVPLLNGDSKPVDVSAIKIAGGVALVLLVVGLFGWAAQQFSSDNGNLPGGNHSYLRQGADDEANEDGSYPNGKGSNRKGANASGGAKSNLPNAAPPGSGGQPSPAGGVAPGSQGNAGPGTAPNLTPTAPGVISSREGEFQHLPEWSQSSAMLAHSGTPVGGALSSGSPGAPLPTDVPRSAAGVMGPRVGGTTVAPKGTPSASVSGAPPPPSGGTTVPVANGGIPSGSTPQDVVRAPSGPSPAPAARIYAPRPPADIKIAAGAPPQYISPDLKPSGPGRSGSAAPSGGTTGPVVGTPPPPRGNGRPNDNTPPSHVGEPVSSLHAALVNLPPEGGTIELTGSGPFFLPSIDLQGRKRIIVRAAETFTPILVFVPESDPEANAASLIRVSDGTLNLIGLNFVIVADQFPSNDSLTMVEVDAGDLVVHDCSFTLVGKRSGPTSAIRLSGAGNWKDRTPAHQSRTLLNRVWIRGDGITGLNVIQSAADIIVNNSLLTTGSSPAFAFTTDEQQTAESSNATRVCRVLSSTLVADVAWTFADAAASPNTQIATVNSLIANHRRQSDKPMLFAQGAFDASAASRSALSWLDWQTDGTLFCGWPKLVRMENPSGMPVVNLANAQDWQKFWKQPLPIDPFQADDWPKQPIDDWLAVTPYTFYAGTLSAQALSVTPAGLPGCFIEQLLVPTPPQFDRAMAWARKPRIPADFFDPGSGEALTVNINEEDLGLWLAKHDLSPGAVVIAEGMGFCESHPIEIVDATVSIQFRSTGSTPPILIPLMTNAAPEGLSVLNPAFILVSRGRLELRDAIVLIEPSKDKRGDSIPDWLLRVEEGSFALRHCFLRGPTAPSGNWKGLIYWSGLPSSRSQSSPQSAGVIVDSFLYGHEQLIRGDLAGQVLSARNSVFSTSGRVAEFRLPNGPSPNVVDLQRCTLSSSFACFAVTHVGEKPAADAKLTFYSEETAFAVPKGYRAGDETQQIVLTTRGDFSREQLDWWEFSNAYADSFAHFRGKIGEPLGDSQDFTEDWVNHWGPSRVQRALYAKNAVALQGQSRSRSPDEWGIGDFNIDKLSQAATWSETGAPIGAKIVDEPGPVAKPAAEKSRPSTPKGVPAKGKPKFNP